MNRPRVLSVGQCGFDHGTITRHLAKSFGAEVHGADSFDQAVLALRSERFDLVLVNRISDRGGARGVDLIRRLKADPELASVPVMLVSDIESAQVEATNLGALPGFGKSALRSGQADLTLKNALATDLST
jgi:two-component system chemotaxis response regulator CheY